MGGKSMKKKLQFFVLIISMLILSSCGEKHYNEWVEKNGNKYYYDEQSELATGWIAYQGNWYYLDRKEYYMVKNRWVDTNYYVDYDGRMLTNVTKEIGGETYVFDSTGVATKVEPCQLIIDCLLPKTFKYTGVGYWYETIIENVQYEIEYNENMAEYMVTIYLTGTAGNSSTVATFQNYRNVGYKLYDSNNNEIASGEFFTRKSLKYGEKFTHDQVGITIQTEKGIHYMGNLPLKGKGKYRLELLDCDHSYGFGVTC